MRGPEARLVLPVVVSGEKASAQLGKLVSAWYGVFDQTKELQFLDLNVKEDGLGRFGDYRQDLAVSGRQFG